MMHYMHYMMQSEWLMLCCCRDTRVHVPSVQLQGRDAVRPEPPHQVTDSLDEGTQWVRPVLGGLRLTNEPRTTSTRQTSHIKLSCCSCTGCYDQHRSLLKPKFHYADFPVTSATVRGSFGEVGVMEFGLKGRTSRICHRRHGVVGIVEFGLYAADMIQRWHH